MGKRFMLWGFYNQTLNLLQELTLQQTIFLNTTEKF